MSSHFHANDPFSDIDDSGKDLENAFAAAEIGFWVWDLNDRFSWDAQTCQYFGLSEGEQPSSLIDFLALIDESSQEAVLDAADFVRLGGNRLNVVIKTENRGAPSRYLKLVGQRSVSKGLPLRRLSGVCMPADNSEINPIGRVRLKDSWREFTEISSDLCAEINTNGHFINLNSSMERMFGYRTNELVGRSIFDLIHPNDISRTREVIERILDGVDRTAPVTLNETFENRLRTKDGDYHWLSWSWIANSRDRQIYGMARDVTESKRLQEEQIETIHQLKRSNDDLRNFASVASHDLKEPLRMVTRYLRLLEVSSPDLIDTQGQKYIDYACDGADRMRQLIDDLLAYSRLDQEVLKSQELELSEVLATALKDLRKMIEDSEATVEIDAVSGAIVFGDPTRLLRVFRNLLSNAVKFHNSDSRPKIEVFFRQMKGPNGIDGWRVDIKDNGIGIDPDHKELMFNLFQRLNPRQDFEGSGIGLAVCKRIIEMHEGFITVDSIPKKGSTFYVWLKSPSAHSQ